MEVLHEVEPSEERLDVGALNARPTAMDEPYLPEPTGSRFGQVLERDIADLVGTKGMQVERIGDRDLDRLVVHGAKHSRGGAWA